MNRLLTYTKQFCFGAVFLFVLFFNGCKEDPTPSVYDPGYSKAETPVIGSITPAGNLLAGISMVTITGSNFSPAKERNIVYFDGTLVTVIEATTTTLKLQAPNIVKDSVKIKVTTLDAINFSTVSLVNIKSAIAEIGSFKSFEAPNAITADIAGNLYVSLVSNNQGMGVIKIAPDGTRSQFAPKGAETSWFNMKLGPGGDIYGVRNQPALFIIKANTTPATFISSGISPVKLQDLDFDINKNIWMGGSVTDPTTNKIFSVTQAKVLKSFAFNGDIRALRVYNGYLYIAATRDSNELVLRKQIFSSDSLGAEETYFNFTAAYGKTAGKVWAITFAQDGDLYLGTEYIDAIIIVHPDKSFEPLYKGVVTLKATKLTWNDGNYMYYTREPGISQTIFRVDMQKPGAPYYGRQ
ncbi:MAG: IPT/TIG domain-containing protein [Ignavibacteriales bacterium]|nr:IPT/TIG domain-containing protein [Ignavibacteriales bacterium]